MISIKDTNSYGNYWFWTDAYVILYCGLTVYGVRAVCRFLRKLKAAGLGSLPGTAAEVLDHDVRAALCPDKLSVDLWLQARSMLLTLEPYSVQMSDCRAIGYHSVVESCCSLLRSPFWQECTVLLDSPSLSLSLYVSDMSDMHCDAGFLSDMHCDAGLLSDMHFDAGFPQSC